MTNKEIQRRVRQFRKEFGVYKCEYAELRKATEKQGYTIVEFNSIANDADVKTLVEMLGLQGYISCSKGFTYADANYRMVFIHEDLNEDEKIKVLIHENGHIFLDHFSSAQVIGKDVQEEYEANEFLHYLLKKSPKNILHNGVVRHKKLCIVTAFVILVGLIAVTVLGLMAKQKTQYEDFGANHTYYITATGNKYHKKECMTIKDKDSLQQLTIERMESGEYQPCRVCLPD